MKLISDATKCLEHDEGYKDKLYYDKTGVTYKKGGSELTIGVGYNIEERGLPEDIIYTLLARDIEESIHSAERLIGAEWKTFSHYQKLALVNLVFNLGED